MRSNNGHIFLVLIAMSFLTLNVGLAQHRSQNEKACNPCDQRSACQIVEGRSSHDLSTIDVNSLFDCVLVKKDIQVPLMLDGGYISGNVTAEIVLDKKGTLLDVRIVDGYSMARQAAIDSITKWTFRRVKLPNGYRTVRGLVEVHFDFRRH